MPFPKIMPLIIALTRDSGVVQALRSLRRETHSVAVARTWERLSWLVRERPATAVVLDSGALLDDLTEDVAVGELRRRFPSLATVFVARPQADPIALFRLGRAGLRSLVLLPGEALSSVAQALRQALSGSTEAVVTRAMSAFVPPRETAAIRMALEGVQRGWDTEELAEQVGLTRPHVSVRLKSCGLPSAGHALIWAKLLHAGSWLADPGRSAESVARQLEYSSGAAFRRALRNYVGMRPMEVRARGGLRPVLIRFLDACGLGDSVHVGSSPE